MPLKRDHRSLPAAGVKTAVLVPIEEWERLQRAARPSLKEVLLAPEPRFDNIVGERRVWRRRPIVEFE
jgi:antitoxin Phd